jgi:hypothetical protein
VSEITWYSRFAIWVGAVVLLVQALAGRGTGFMSFISVVLMAGGLAGFVFGLIWDARAPRPSAQAEPGVLAREPEAVLPRTDEVQAETFVEVAEVEPETSSQAAETVPEDEVTSTARAEPEVQVSVDPAPTPMTLSNRVETEEIASGSVLIGRACVRCGRLLLMEQMAATCPVCRNPQHAACWIENHFRCSTPGCGGRGSLEAPRTSSED